MLETPGPSVPMVEQLVLGSPLHSTHLCGDGVSDDGLVTMLSGYCSTLRWSAGTSTVPHLVSA